MSRPIRFLCVAAVLLAALVSATDAPVAVAAHDDVIAVVVDGVGVSSDQNMPWTCVLDADVLAARYGLAAVVTVSVVTSEAGGTQVRIVGPNGTIRSMASSTFATNHGLPSDRFTLGAVLRDTVGGHVAMIGDSVGVSIAGTATSELPILTDGTFDSFVADVLVSRFISKTPPTPSGLQAAAEVPLNSDVVVVELGYNPSTNMTADIDAMMTALVGRGTKRVIWVNMAEIRQTVPGVSDFASANAALEASGKRWPTIFDNRGLEWCQHDTRYRPVGPVPRRCPPHRDGTGGIRTLAPSNPHGLLVRRTGHRCTSVPSRTSASN